MSVITHDFGKKERQTVQRFRSLLTCKRHTMTIYRGPWKFAYVSTSYWVDTNCDADINRRGI